MGDMTIAYLETVKEQIAERAKLAQNDFGVASFPAYKEYLAEDKAVKQDQGKLRYDLIPKFPLQELARVYTIGAAKYADHNWRKGFDYSRVIAALMRHLEAWRAGEEVDPADGQLHLASVIWNAMTLMEFQRTGAGKDDRMDKDPTKIVKECKCP